MNVIVIHYGGMLVEGKYKTFVFYEGLAEALQKNGNNVMEIITNDFLERPWNGSNKLKHKINRPRLIKRLVDFDPDLIISFNNSSIEGLENEVQCPIVIWDADHFYHFNDLEKLKSNKDRFIFFCSQSSDISDCQKILGADPKRCFLVKPATSIRADSGNHKTENIIFIGTPFGNHSERDKLHKYRKQYIELTKKLIDKEIDLDYLVHEYRKIPDLQQTILDFGSVATRTNTLAHVAPLGMSIYGGAGWLDVGLDSSLDIFDAYNSKKIYSISQTQEAYNSSKIGLNINHTQAKSGYSWRVMDILASSAVLVSNYSQDLADELGDLSKEIFYNNPREAYELCSKLLKDEALRKDIVRRSNEIVNKFHTWEKRVSEIENILQLQLVNEQAIKGGYVLLEAKDYQRFLFVGVSRFTRSRGLLRRFFRRYNENVLVRGLRFITPYGIVKMVRYIFRIKI